MKNLVIIGLVIPEPNSTAAGTRMMQLIEIFRQNNYKITFLTSANNFEFSEKIEIEKIEINNSSFDEKIKEINPDVVLFDRFITEEQLGWRVSEVCPNAVKILDTEDLHFLRKSRETAFKQSKNVEFSDYINDTFKREIASILRCDLSLIISEFELNLLTESFKISSEILFYIPFVIDKFSEDFSTFHQRKNFVSIGNFLHEPNWQTVLKLKQLWPKIRKQIPNSELHIFGAYASEKVFQLHNEKEGFIVKGRAESAEEIFTNYRVLLAPIPFGAGLKGKIWEGMKFGIPNVTTEIGSEGMHGNLDWNGFITNSDDDFIQKSVELYQNEEAWKKLQENGKIILEKRFKKSDFDGKLLMKIDEISENLQKYRNANFLGQILQHHQLNSTKYLSKWIEEKNKIF